MNATPRFFAVLSPFRSVPQFVVTCNIVLSKMSGSAVYANPPIAYATALLHVAALDKAQQAVPENGAADRDAKLAVCRADMRQFKAFAQGLADADLANAQTLIENTGMLASKRPPRSKQNLAARNGSVPGRVHVDAKAAKGKASYHWQMRVGPGTWGDLPETVVAKTMVDGLTPATVVEFRFRSLRREGYSDWSSPVSIIVH
jgi:hypothetical protein